MKIVVKGASAYALAWMMSVYGVSLTMLAIYVCSDSVSRWGWTGVAVAGWAFVAYVVLMVPWYLVFTIPSEEKV